MQTLILCGGKGTRLREETEYKPKPMVAVGEKPILWHIMEIYASYGFSDFALALGYRGNSIRDYFLNYTFYNNDFTTKLGGHDKVQVHKNAKSKVNWQVTLAETGADSLTGSRVKQCEKYITGDRFFLTYGDAVADIDIKALLEFHKSHGKIATVTGVNPPSRWGELEINENNQVSAFMEKAKTRKHDHFINGGFFVFERRLFDLLDTDSNCILEKDPMEQLAKDGELMVYRHNGFWQCMDTYRDYLYLNDLWNANKSPWLTKQMLTI